MDFAVKQNRGMYPEFSRKGEQAPRASHYCAGCGHGIVHKLVAEALADMGLQDRTVLISPVGCAVFAYYYFDCGNIQAAHGRAMAVGTGLARSLPESIIISYQGDGDLASIGLCESMHAANRGEKLAVFFVNNAVYGMTGGQMAPTTLLGQRTVTCPGGRDQETSGYPLHVCELFNTLPAPVYLERCSLADSARIQKARRAVRHALEIQRDGKGFAMVEFLSPCPTNMRGTAVASNQFIIDSMEKEFPLGCFRDRAAEIEPATRSAAPPTPVDQLLAGTGAPCEEPLTDPAFGEVRLKFAGHGGQGILRLGLLLAEAASRNRRHVTWFPSYGPEQRGGTASCSVVIAGSPIGSPVVADADLLIAMNQSSLDRFARDVRPGGVIICDSTAESLPALSDRELIQLPALKIAAEHNCPQAANTAMLAALAFSDRSGLPSSTIAEVVGRAFAAKASVRAQNETIYRAADEWCRLHLRP